MTDELVSIVVPVYNVRDYLDQCISSVLNQTYRNIEVIVVTANSSDGSNEICEKYAALDHRIKLITQQNPGLSAARKEGTAVAAGEYIGYIDSDDYIDADLFERLMACKNGFDLVVARWNREDGLQTRETGDALALGAYQSEEDMNFLLDHMVDISLAGGGGHVKSGIAAFVWNKLHKTEIAREVFEEAGQSVYFVEDCDFTYRYLLKCKSVLLTDICGYHYRIRSSSGSHTAEGRRNYLENIGKFYAAISPVLAAHPRGDALLPQLQRKVARWLNRTPNKMGFVPAAQNKVLVFPYLNLLDGKNIILCGAGLVGQNYWIQIQQHGICKISLWIDQKWSYYRREGRDVSPMESLQDSSYDCAVIAAFHQETADSIHRTLRSLGVDEEKILWKPPLVF